MISETLKSIDPQDDAHSWAYKAANQYAASKVDVTKLFDEAATAQEYILKARIDYESLFDAFVCGAVFGKNEKE